MHILSFHKITPDQLALVGGKGLNLARLTQLGVNVPAGFVVTTESYRQFARVPLPSSFRNELLDAFATLRAPLVAVRSSAVAEDGRQNSWAGQFATYLDVTRDTLLQRIQDSWASVYSRHATAYGDTSTEMAVVVQQMIPSESAGVLFTANPVNGAQSEIVIEAVYGLGELLVQGASIPDNFVLSKTTHQVITQEIGHKDQMLIHKDGQHVQVPVSAAKQDSPVLNDDQLAELAKTGQYIEAKYGYPLDLEWAYYDNQLFILQARPITTL